MKQERGFMLIISLLLGILLLVLTLALMARDAQRQGQVHQFGRSTQALELAEAGLEDARVKLDKDLRLPLRGDAVQTLINYTETLPDQPQASYTVTIDWSQSAPPIEQIKVTSRGAFESYSRTLVELLDVAPKRDGFLNQGYFRMCQRQDRSSF
jgi:hypothetical protein